VTERVVIKITGTNDVEARCLQGSGFRPEISASGHPHLHGLCAHRYAFPGRLAGASSQASLRILFPPDGAQLDLATTDGKRMQCR
jgi:hypothetical protein